LLRKISADRGLRIVKDSTTDSVVTNVIEGTERSLTERSSAKDSMSSTNDSADDTTATKLTQEDEALSMASAKADALLKSLNEYDILPSKRSNGGERVGFAREHREFPDCTERLPGCHGKARTRKGKARTCGNCQAKKTEEVKRRKVNTAKEKEKAKRAAPAEEKKGEEKATSDVGALSL
jgi:hypothetical protein